MTHDEACELVQGSVERALTTLLHIQKRLEKGKPFSRQDELRVKDFDVLYNINFYGAFLQGARKMYLALHDHGIRKGQKRKGKIREIRIQEGGCKI